jgi:hypothetical protein
VQSPRAFDLLRLLAIYRHVAPPAQREQADAELQRQQPQQHPHSQFLSLLPLQLVERVGSSSSSSSSSSQSALDGSLYRCCVSLDEIAPLAEERSIDISSLMAAY